MKRTITGAEQADMMNRQDFLPAERYPLALRAEQFEIGALVEWDVPGERILQVKERVFMDAPRAVEEKRQARQYITTQLVELEADNGAVVRAHFPALKIGGAPFYMDVDKASAEEQFHAIDRLEVGFGLAMEGMKQGLRFRRPCWPPYMLGVALVNGKLTAKYEHNGENTNALESMRAEDLVAEDWVVAP